ncbi:MAG: RNAase P [Thermoplasmata archaeon]|nr:RNAase P [Thermoplasmata archaeon]
MSRKKARRFGKKKEMRQRIAKERIKILLAMAEEQALAGEMELADRYTFLARKIGMRYQVRMPRGFNLIFCRKCLTYLVPSRNSTFRMTGGRITRQCLKCGSYYRLPIGVKREQ